MKVTQIFILILSCLLLGCASIPFQKTDYFIVKDINPILVKNKFSDLLPSNFKVINTVIFKYRTKSFLSLGYIGIDAEERYFEMAGMSPMGIKLIEFVGRNNQLEVSNVVDEISQKGDLSKIIGEDINRIYFDQIPSSEATIYKKNKEIIFSENQGLGRLEYVFAGKDNLLVEKRFLKGRKKIWSVCYYEYFFDAGKVYPRGIIFNNYAYSYKLIVNLKDII